MVMIAFALIINNKNLLKYFLNVLTISLLARKHLDVGQSDNKRF
jgi:hypothetical protein